MCHKLSHPLFLHYYSLPQLFPIFSIFLAIVISCYRYILLSLHLAIVTSFLSLFITDDEGIQHNITTKDCSYEQSL